MTVILYSDCQNLMPQVEPTSEEVTFGRSYLAQTRGTSRSTDRVKGVGFVAGRGGAHIRPILYLLHHRELVSGPFCYSKPPEVVCSGLARAPEYRTHSHQAKRRCFQG